MPRKLAPSVYWKHGAYHLVDRDKKWVRLGATDAEAYKRLAELETPHASMLKLFDRYAREILPKKSLATRKAQEAQIINLKRSFGRMVPGEILPVDVAAYHDARGQDAPVMANRELSLLSHVFKHALRWGIVQRNPCIGLARHKETPRTRYVTDKEFVQVYRCAPIQVRAMMRMARLTGQRESDLLRLRRADLLKEGIAFTQAKTGKKLIVTWTKTLEAAVRFCKRLPGPSSLWLIHKEDGQKYTTSGFQTAWQKLMRKIAEEKMERFTFHDLRAKASSDGDDERLLGHADPAKMRRVYRRLPEKVRPLK